MEWLDEEARLLRLELRSGKLGVNFLVDKEPGGTSNGNCDFIVVVVVDSRKDNGDVWVS